MKTAYKKQIEFEVRQESITMWAEQFIIERKVRGVSDGTIVFYTEKIKNFLSWCDSQLIYSMDQLTPNAVRQYLLWLEEGGHNPGGIHAYFRTVKAFLKWYETENPGSWKNPIQLVKSPKVPGKIIEPISIENVQKMMSSCERGTYCGDRDLAILYILFDTGVRMKELLNVCRHDYNPIDRSLIIQKGKGSKPRTVYVGVEASKYLKNWLKHRSDNVEAMWVSDEGNKLTYNSMRHIIRRIAQRVGIREPGFHEFRRAYALNSLRGGIDLISLQRLMGHSNLSILNRYLAQTSEDLKIAHDRTSPADRLIKKR